MSKFNEKYGLNQVYKDASNLRMYWEMGFYVVYTFRNTLCLYIYFKMKNIMAALAVAISTGYQIPIYCSNPKKSDCVILLKLTILTNIYAKIEFMP